MPANTAPIFALTPVVGIATLTSPTAVTSRANISGTTNLTLLVNSDTNGTTVSTIVVTAKGNTAAGTVGIWLYDGSTSYLFDEIVVSAVTASTTVPSFTSSKDYSTLVLPSTVDLYVSSTIVQDFNIVALGGSY